MLNAASNLALVRCRWGTRDRFHFPLWIPTKTREGGNNWEFRQDLTTDENGHDNEGCAYGCAHNSVQNMPAVINSYARDLKSNGK